jgi:diacylglycerol kinase family enzyme
MHIYIYDSFLSQKKYLTQVHEAEAKITDLGLSGRVCRLGQLRSLSDVVREELRRAPKTIVAIGDDALVSQVISLMGGSGVVLGIIPIGESNKIAEGLGINYENACNVLAARRIVKIDLGLLDNRAFVRRAEFIGKKIKLEIDGNYSITAPGTKIEVINFFLDNDTSISETKTEPQSGNLYLMITKEEKSGFMKKGYERSLIPFKDLRIQTDEIEALLDGLTTVRHPKQVSVLPKGLEVIVGRERQF